MISSTQTTIQRVVEEFVRDELSNENPHIAGAVWSMLDAGGKRLRPRITMLAGLACDASAPEDPVLASYMELIHVATLIHDDVVDNADVRRGRESTNYAYGNRFSVLAGDYLFAWVFKKITQAYAPPVPTILAAMLSEICNGEVKELRATADATLSTERYFEIIGKKTAELFAACAECGGIVATQHRHQALGPGVRELSQIRTLRQYGYAFGMAFQIRDDLLDVTSNQAAMGKPAGSDLREKKVTLPLIYALETEGQHLARQIEQLFACDDAGSVQAASTLSTVVERIRASSAIRRSAQTMAEYAVAAEAALAPLPPSAAREELCELARSLSEFSP